MDFNVIFFPDFETLDVFGPVEVFGKLEGCTIGYYSQHGGLVSNSDGISINTESVSEIRKQKENVLFIPGGMGTRKEFDNSELLELIKVLAQDSSYVLTVCTGSALLAKTGLLDGRRATSNKRSFDWVKTSSGKVDWIREARWVIDGKFYTSSGISAGIDMALGFVSDLFGKDTAEQIAYRIEYNWQQDSTKDDFSNQ